MQMSAEGVAITKILRERGIDFWTLHISILFKIQTTLMHFSNMPAGNKQKTQIVTVTPLVRKSKGRAGNTMHYYLLRAWRQRGTTDDDGERNVTKNEIIKDVARRRESERAVSATVVRLLIYCAHVGMHICGILRKRG